jgi:hypothetical protein
MVSEKLRRRMARFQLRILDGFIRLAECDQISELHFIARLIWEDSMMLMDLIAQEKKKGGVTQHPPLSARF